MRMRTEDYGDEKEVKLKEMVGLGPQLETPPPEEKQ